MIGRGAVSAFALLLAVAGHPVPAQQFDSLGGGTLEGFALNPDAAIDPDAPSLGTDDGLPTTGPEIQLQITEGQPDVTLRSFPGTGSPITSVFQPETAQAPRVVLRALDKMLGRPIDIDLAMGETIMFGRLAIRAIECRYPVEDPSSDAFVHLEVLTDAGAPVFDGWMVASSPALVALEHPRYDVWALRCSDG
ncbi:DUF2155 domain-containing protein [Roseicyclus marinus]|uniref:DUF2155 domain-containing protein n=1 Tax=Roseicyclus marinus TaxID=2161673 RepID=UPI00241054B7|nr:DUF2155 domain-containing protein [Roseicyclus marinus]MDG3042320.1 DUF2155 domain-containing protein [Roseicyclus marinus]